MNSQFKDANSILSVTLRKNHFKDDESSFIGRVTRNTVTLENLIASISEKHSGISPYMIQHVANLLSNEMLIACKNAKAVDVLGLGTLFIGVAGSINGENPSESSIPGFKLNFTPSAKAQKTLDSLKVDKVIIADSNPAIDKIVNTFNQDVDRNLIKGKGVKITGTKLKLLGEDAGIWFCPLDTEGNIDKDESLWQKVNPETISMNKPKTIEFYVPDEMTSQNYRILIRTRFSNGDTILKNPITAISKIVAVA